VLLEVDAYHTQAKRALSRPVASTHLLHIAGRSTAADELAVWTLAGVAPFADVVCVRVQHERGQ
jgi:hypothetical protein